MKKVIFKIYDHDIEKYSKPIRSRYEAIEILLGAIKSINVNERLDSLESNSIELYIDKMSRLFVFLDNKFYSINFPFTLYAGDGDQLQIVVNDEYVIDISACNYIISGIKQFSNINIGYENIKDTIFFDIIEDYPNDEKLGQIYFDKCIKILDELFSFEIGYIRYDYDEENCDEEMHPLNHVDINFSSNCTYKIGLKSNMLKGNFIDILNIRTKCAFIE